MRFLRTIACAAIAALAAGCGGHDLAPSTPPRPAAVESAQRTATLRIVVKIPKVHRKRRARYISPDTKSMKLILAPVKGTPLRQTIDLTPTTSGCAPSSAGTLCTRTLNLVAGRYTATVSMYDAIGGGGALLSSGQNLSVDVVIGKTNQIRMTLNGIPHAITITGLTPGVHGSQGSGFTLYGNTAQNFNVVATDADSIPIVGPGAPAFTTSILSGAGWAAPTPAPTTPNTLLVTPPAASGLTATIQINATYSDPTTCSAPGAACSATISLLHHLQNVWVLDTGSSTVDEYAYPYTGASPIVSIADSGGNIGGTNQNAQGFAMDAQGDIFVANCSATCSVLPTPPPDSVTEYAAPGYSSTPVRTITTGIANPEALAVDASGNLFVANQNGSITEYAPNTAAPAVTITTGIQVPVGLALDSSNNLYVLNCATSCAGTGSDTILKYAFPYTGMPATIGTIGTPAPGAIVVDSSGNVFAGNAGAVTEYPSGSATATTMSVDGEALAIALDGAGNLFAGGCASCVPTSDPDTLLEYAPPYTGSAKTIDSSATSNFGHPAAVTIDSAGNLIVANGNYNALLVYAWPYTGAPQTSLSTLNGPTGLILTP